VRLVKSGDIATKGALKAEFKALARRLHPDALGLPGDRSDGEAFARAREEYEEALRWFDGGYPGARASGGSARGADRASFYADLGALFRKGFPREPRHEKEKAAHARRIRTISAWLEQGASHAHALAFDRVEPAARALKDASPRAFDAFKRLALEIVGFHATGIEALRSSARLSFPLLLAELPNAPGVSESPERPESRETAVTIPGSIDRGGSAALVAFIGFLVADLANGPAFA
jgi:hypothetical protein